MAMTRTATAPNAAIRGAAVKPAVADTPAGEQTGRLSLAQRDWLKRGLDQPGGKLPLFDKQGKRISERTIRACIEQGWAEPWFANPLKPDWLVCKLTAHGRRLATAE